VSSQRSAAERRVVSSALWAAWGDALGFITELAGAPEEISRRAGRSEVTNTVRWSRRIGGRFGPLVDLPAGTYSDDTQLRLAVSRCVRATGRFDLEAFSKIELPVFLSYEMRAGKGTKAAAYALMKRHVRWSGNFFDNERATYVNAGGNGAAMRIQPHVWSAPGFNPNRFIGWVAADAVVTHGHPRGVIGAVIHANALSSVLRHGEVPNPDLWNQIVEYAGAVTEVMSSHEVLRDRWLPAWEQAAGRAWAAAVTETIAEGREMIAAAQTAIKQGDASTAYRDLLARIGGLSRQTVGSGMVAAVSSLVAAWLYRDRPAEGIRVIANQLKSDTDTIATLAGALLGARTDAPPPGPVMDHDYIVDEAKRMFAIANRDDAVSFPHPDPMKWRPPATLLDAVGVASDGCLAIAGLGPVVETSSEYTSEGGNPAVWQWMTLGYGQTVLIKRRENPRPLPPTAVPVERPARRTSNGSGQPLLFDERVSTPASADGSTGLAKNTDLEAAIARVIDSDFDERVIGRELLTLVALPDRELAGEFVIAIKTAIRARTD
jgi:ADP-ribosylglycohydrolase